MCPAPGAAHKRTMCNMYHATQDKAWRVAWPVRPILMCGGVQTAAAHPLLISSTLITECELLLEL